MGGKGTGVSHQRERIFRVNEIWKMVLRFHGHKTEEIIGTFSYKYGTGRRTTREYIKTLIAAGKIKEKDKCLWRK